MSTTSPAELTHAYGHGGEVQTTKRDFLMLVAGAGAAIGVGAIIWPMIDSMNPASDVLALSSIEVDLTPITEGMGITTVWRGKPIFVRHRTPEEIKTVEAVPLNQLIEPATDQSRIKDGHAQWIVLIGICTHLGCVPLGNKPTDPRGEYGAGSAPATAASMTSPAASGMARRPPTCICRLTPSRATPR